MSGNNEVIAKRDAATGIAYRRLPVKQCRYLSRTRFVIARSVATGRSRCRNSRPDRVGIATLRLSFAILLSFVQSPVAMTLVTNWVRIRCL